MPLLTLRLFGELEVRLSGALIRPKTIKASALIALLVVDSDHPHRRESLAGILWPDYTEESAHDNLRVTLYQLRRLLADQENIHPFLILSRTSVQFDPASDYWLDVFEFTTLFRDCNRHAHNRLESCEACMHRFAQAAELYKGDFLAMASSVGSNLFEEWAQVRRQELKNQATMIFGKLADFHVKRQDYDQAILYAQRHLTLDSLDELAHRQLMLALSRSGRRTAAMRQYESLRRMLADEMGVTPSEDTTLLYIQIRDGLASPPEVLVAP